ncbi:MAG: REP-associated tyrosine transposase [Armatimonadota bacterium]
MDRLIRKTLRIEGFDYSCADHVIFVTMCARHKGAPFSDPALAKCVVDAIQWSRRANRWRVFCYCLMPDHLHLVLSPAGDNELLWVIAAFKRWTTRQAWARGIRGQLWQRSWYDHIARQEEDLLRICEYTMANPVRRGLVSDVENWPYSDLLDPLPV